VENTCGKLAVVSRRVTFACYPAFQQRRQLKMVKKQMEWVPPTRTPDDPLEVLDASERPFDDILKALWLLEPLARHGYGWLTVDDLVGSSDSDGIFHGGLLPAFRKQHRDRPRAKFGSPEDGGGASVSDVTFEIMAKFEPEMDERRAKRVDDVLERYDLFFKVDHNACCEEDGAHATDTSIYLRVDGAEKASRIASELRACGMVVVLKEWVIGSDLQMQGHLEPRPASWLKP
jgi:hypothetical protein